MSMVGRMYWCGVCVCVVERSGRWRDDQDKIWRRFDPRYVNRDAEEKKKRQCYEVEIKTRREEKENEE